MTTPDEGLAALTEFVRRARHAAASLTQDPAGYEIIKLIMRTEDLVMAWRRNPGAIVEPLTAETMPDTDELGMAGVLAGLLSITRGSAFPWATADHIAERISRPIEDVLGALETGMRKGWIESTRHFTTTNEGDQWFDEEGTELLGD